MQRGIEIDPLSPLSNYFLCESLFYARRFDDCATQARAAVELFPETHILLWPVGWCAGVRGAFGEAIDAFERAARISQDPISESYLGWAYALAGKRNRAERIARDSERNRASRYFPAGLIAVVHAGLGNDEDAIKWLERAYDEKDVWVTPINRWAPFDSLRSNPRFQYLELKLNLPPVRLVQDGPEE